MKKFTKGMLIAAGIFGAAGIGLTIAGGVMGASMSELNGFESISKILWTERDVVEPGRWRMMHQKTLRIWML